MGKAYVVIGIIIFAVQIYAGRPCRDNPNLAVLMWLPELVQHVWYADRPLREYIVPKGCIFKRW